MATQKYDWTKLKNEYIRGNTISAKDFLKENNVLITGSSYAKINGWQEEREQFQKELQEKTNEEVITKVAETTADIRARQAKTAKMLQFKGVKYISDKDKSPKNIDQARRLVVEGLREEREALDLNRRELPQVGSVNIAVFNTRYGEMLKGLNYGQLADILRRLDEKSKSSGGVGVGGVHPTTTASVEGEII